MCRSVASDSSCDLEELCSGISPVNIMPKTTAISVKRVVERILVFFFLLRIKLCAPDYVRGPNHECRPVANDSDAAGQLSFGLT